MVAEGGGRDKGEAVGRVEPSKLFSTPRYFNFVTPGGTTKTSQLQKGN